MDPFDATALPLPQPAAHLSPLGPDGLVITAQSLVAPAGTCFRHRLYPAHQPSTGRDPSSTTLPFGLIL